MKFEVVMEVILDFHRHHCFPPFILPFYALLVVVLSFYHKYEVPDLTFRDPMSRDIDGPTNPDHKTRGDGRRAVGLLRGRPIKVVLSFLRIRNLGSHFAAVKE